MVEHFSVNILRYHLSLRELESASKYIFMIGNINSKLLRKEIFASIYFDLSKIPNRFNKTLENETND